MLDPKAIEAALQRLIASTASGADFDVLREVLLELQTGNLTLDVGGRRVTVAGSASQNQITTGDRNQVISLSGLDADAVERALERLLPEKLPLLLHTIPAPPSDFTGRANELAKLREGVQAGGAIIRGVRGMGGVGKTTLAVALADGLRSDYPDAQLVVDLRGSTDRPLTAAEALTVVIQAFHPEARLPEDEPSLQKLFLTTLDDKRAILLLDDASGAPQVAPLMPPASWALLVTTRRAFALPGLHLEQIGVLPRKKSRELLLRIAPRIGDQADRIADLCGDLPLALRLAGSMLAARQDIDVHQYTALLEKEAQRLTQIDKAQPLTKEERGVEASLRSSYELLGEDIQRRWRQLAIFPDTFEASAAAAIWQANDRQPDEPQPARRGLWNRAVSLVQSMLRPTSATPNTAESIPVDEALGRLIGYSLLEWNDETRRYRLHDLARIFADQQQTESERSNGRRQHSHHYLAALDTSNEQFLTGGLTTLAGLLSFDVERGNIEAGQQWAVAHCRRRRRCGMDLPSLSWGRSPHSVATTPSAGANHLAG